MCIFFCWLFGGSVLETYRWKHWAVSSVQYCRETVLYIMNITKINLKYHVRLYLLHTCVATRQLLPEIGDVMVVLFQVLLEVVTSERQQGFLYLWVELWKQGTQLLVISTMA